MKIIKFLFWNLITLFFLLVAVDVGFRIYYHDVDVPKEWLKYSTDWVQKAPEDCEFLDRLLPSPFLSHVMLQPPDCPLWRGINNRGFMGTYDYPQERDPNYYSILVLGGSVANLVSMFPSQDHASFIEVVLNSNFTSPNGKPFRVYVGANGGYTYPLQMIVYILYGHLFDAVIAIDGYNESVSYATLNSLIWPPMSVWTTAILNRTDDWRYEFLKKASKAKDFLIKFDYFKTSYFFFQLYKTTNYSIKSRILDPRAYFDKLEDYYRYDPNTPPEKIYELNDIHYARYIEYLNALTKTSGQKYAHFLQPVRFLKKKLTAEEDFFVEPSKPEIYTDHLIPLFARAKKKGLPVFDMTGLLENVEQTVYADHIHFIQKGDRSFGFELFSEQIALRLEKAWNLKRKTPRFLTYQQIFESRPIEDLKIKK